MFITCVFRELDLNWVSTKIFDIRLLMAFDSGMSMSRYLPARGTAGLERDEVSGARRVPRPPPRITVMQDDMEAPSHKEAKVGECCDADNSLSHKP